jgi:hypothetical protein
MLNYPSDRQPELDRFNSFKVNTYFLPITSTL